MILKRREILFHQGEESDIYVLKEGLLKVVRVHSNGSSFLFNLLVPGECFPHHSLLTPICNFGTVSAVVDCEIECIPKEKWYVQIKAEPYRYREIAVDLQETLRRVQQRTQILLAPPKERLALFREWLGESDYGMDLEGLLTQEEIGQFIGLTRETVNRIFNDKE